MEILKAGALSPTAFRRIDESDDAQFYDFPRFTVHIDDAAIAAIGEIYRSRLPTGGVILDLMSSWRSHLPGSVEPAIVVGLGLNRAEMDDNPALNEVIVHDLNRNTRLPFDDSSFDAAVLTVSVQYLTSPIETFREVGRILKPRSPFIVTFSNRMFPTKAVAIWVGSTEAQRAALVERYFLDSAAFETIELIEKNKDGDSDPVYAVVGTRRLNE